MSRIPAAIALIFLLLVANASAITAQGTPAATGGSLAELGLPEVTITATEEGYEVPADVQADTVLLTLNNTAPFPVGFSLVQLPEGVSLDDLMPPPAPEGATPDPNAEPSPEELFPPVLYDAIWAGGVFAFPGTPGQAVVTLTPGEWLLLGPPDIPLPPTTMTVGGEAAEAPAAPEGSVRIELDNFQIRMPDDITAGPQIWHLTNVGEQPHELFLTKTPERLTIEQAEAMLEMAPDATPDPNMPNPEEFEDVIFIAPISQDRSTMVDVTLEPGHYVAICFIPEQESGEAHAMKGMITVFSVGTEGEDVDPPASAVPEEHDGH